MLTRVSFRSRKDESLRNLYLSTEKCSTCGTCMDVQLLQLLRMPLLRFNFTQPLNVHPMMAHAASA